MIFYDEAQNIMDGSPKTLCMALEEYHTWLWPRGAREFETIPTERQDLIRHTWIVNNKRIASLTRFLRPIFLKLDVMLSDNELERLGLQPIARCCTSSVLPVKLVKLLELWASPMMG